MSQMITAVAVLIAAGTADYGGSISTRVDELRTVQSVQIHGRCYSACTLYLGAPDACVSHDAVLGFHGPQLATRGLRMLPADRERWSRVMANHYPPKLSRWFIAEGRHSDDLIFMTGSELIRDFSVKECE